MSFWPGPRCSLGQDRCGYYRYARASAKPKILSNTTLFYSFHRLEGKDANWEAIGQWVQDWNYPAQGLVLHLASEKRGGAKTLLNISASAGCTLTTARGIGIGSSEAAVRKAYGALEAANEGKRGETFVAGSIYGGVIFQFQAGKAAKIFIGAAAE